jgi:hypothetical protein
LNYWKWKNVGVDVHSSMTLDNRIHRMQLLAVSKEIAQRQRPAILYAILGVLALTAFSYEVRPAYQNFPDWLGRPNAPTRPFSAQDKGTEPITIGFLTPDDKKAGVGDGDELVAINGKPVVGTAVFGEAMHAAGAGDISGKGIGAALMMAALEASLRGQAMVAGENLAELMSRVNRLVYEASAANRYATFFYANYDPRSRNLAYVNAGHNPPIVLRTQAQEPQPIRLDAGSLVIGLLRDFSYQQGSFALQPGDLLLLFTDGVSEAMNAAQEECGEEGLIEAARACDGLGAEEIVSRIIAAADAYAAGAPQHDDMTLVALRVSLHSGHGYDL